MKVELLRISECPGWRRAEHNLREALSATGHSDVPVTVRLIETPADAAGIAFSGSPTILIDGVDAFPGTPTGDLACRVYVTAAGLAPAPSIEQITDALIRGDRVSS